MLSVTYDKRNNYPIIALYITYHLYLLRYLLQDKNEFIPSKIGILSCSVVLNINSLQAFWLARHVY